MTTTNEDNFRIEVWDREETTLLETISRSPDFFVSMAGWQAALRRRPASLLIHYNGRHVIEKLLTPGDARLDIGSIVSGSNQAGLDVSLGDLREWHVLRASCRTCKHYAQIQSDGLIKRYGHGALLGSVEKSLFCTSCKKGGPVQLEVHKLPR